MSDDTSSHVRVSHFYDELLLVVSYAGGSNFTTDMDLGMPRLSYRQLFLYLYIFLEIYDDYKYL